MRLKTYCLVFFFILFSSLPFSVFFASSSIEEQESKLFQWLDQHQLSVQWGVASSEDEGSTIDSFLYDSLIYLNWHRNILQFPYVLKWGVKGHFGWNYNKGENEKRLINVSLSSITTLQIINPQYVVPFLELGASTWNVSFDHFSDISFFWGAGVLFSLSIFKPSLSYTLPDEYNLMDIGFLLQFVQQYTSFRNQTYIEDPVYYFHLALYFIF